MRVERIKTSIMEFARVRDYNPMPTGSERMAVLQEKKRAVGLSEAEQQNLESWERDFSKGLCKVHFPDRTNAPAYAALLSEFYGPEAGKAYLASLPSTGAQHDK